MNTKNIAIDGPSGAGKSTLAARLSKELGFVYVDTGALYRTIGVFVRRNRIEPGNCEAVTAVLPQINVALRYVDGLQRMYLNGDDVTDEIRLHEISEYASAVSAHPPVRAFLLETQRKLAEENNVLMDGRDIGTVVLPDADVKIYLTASAEVRARRRALELERRGTPVPFEQVLEDVVSRDRRDMERETAPLKQAEDAILVDTSDMDFEQSFEAILKIVQEKLA